MIFVAFVIIDQDYVNINIYFVHRVVKVNEHPLIVELQLFLGLKYVESILHES